MSTPSLHIVRGNAVHLSIQVILPMYRFDLTVTPPAIVPAIGDQYVASNNGKLYVTYTSSTLIKFVSDQKTNSLATTGTITRVTGSGSTSITYTAVSSTNYPDLTALTLNFRIIRRIVDNPLSSDVILATIPITAHDSPTTGLTSLNLTGTQTATLEIGRFCGVFEFVNSIGEKSEQLNSQVLPIFIEENKV